VFGGVPRVWEKFKLKIEENMARKKPSFIKGLLLSFMQKQAVKAYINMGYGQSGIVPFGYYALCKKLLFKKLQTLLGLHKTTFFVSGAAPISTDTLKWWGTFGIYIYELYGMSELTCTATQNIPSYTRWGTVGPIMKGLDLKIEPKTNEICVRGRTVMLGYMYDVEKTKNAIDSDGYMHSGDIGVVDGDGFLKITGRIKELVITQGGENIAPVPIENYIKNNCQCISNIVIIGDHRKYLTALITLKVKEKENVDSDTPQYTNLLNDSVYALKELDIDKNSILTVQDAKKSKAVQRYIQSAIDQYNEDKIVCVSRAARIQYFKILDNEFSIDSGELTNTQKLRRSVVHHKYKDVIDTMY